MDLMELEANDGNTLFLCAFRYALGRMTYVTQEVADLLIYHSDQLFEETKERIVKEIQQAYATNNYGMAIDRLQWDNVLREFKQQKEGTDDDIEHY
jgi:hypothetical protein